MKCILCNENEGDGIIVGNENRDKPFAELSLMPELTCIWCRREHFSSPEYRTSFKVTDKYFESLHNLYRLVLEDPDILYSL